MNVRDVPPSGALSLRQGAQLSAQRPSRGARDVRRARSLLGSLAHDDGDEEHG